MSFKLGNGRHWAHRAKGLEKRNCIGVIESFFQDKHTCLHKCKHTLHKYTHSCKYNTVIYIHLYIYNVYIHMKHLDP